MNVPTPFNDNARDDRFDRGLERLLAGDPTGIDEIDPELQDAAIEMVKLANEAGWIGSDPGMLQVGRQAWWRNGRQIVNALAAVAVIGLIGIMITMGVRLWDSGGSQFGSNHTEIGLPNLGPGVCTRDPRTTAEIADIVRKTEDAAWPSWSEGVRTELRPWSLQTTRDWNSCLQTGQFDRATGYESEYFIWIIGTELFPNGPGTLSDAEIAKQVIDYHARITPIPTTDGLDLMVWEAERFRMIGHDDGGPYMSGIDAWIARVDDNADWLEWPTVVTIEWDGSQFVIITTTQDGIPRGFLFRNDALPGDAPDATASP